MAQDRSKETRTFGSNQHPVAGEPATVDPDAITRVRDAGVSSPRETIQAGPESIGVMGRSPAAVEQTLGLLSDDEPEEDRSGQVLNGRYRLLERVARGGSGYVYRAHHVTIGKELAVKLLHSVLINRPGQARRFLREAQAAAAISHDNVIELVDYGETTDGAVYVVMEWLKGEDLGETLARAAPFSWKRAKQISLQVCRALNAAHNRGIIHRDLKPENCFRITRRSNRDFIKLLDFGLAKVFGDESAPERSLTKTGSLFGTPEYMSPEQARGVTPDHRTDIYSLGIMLYEMLTGTVPFEADNHIGLLVKQASEIPIPPSDRAPDAGITPEMDRLIMRALEKNPNDRYADVREFAEAIAAIPVTLAPRVAATEGIAQLHESLFGQVRLLQKIVFALAAGVVLLAVALVLALL